jgi:hypothetical protein
LAKDKIIEQLANLQQYIRENPECDFNLVNVKCPPLFFIVHQKHEGDEHSYKYINTMFEYKDLGDKIKIDTNPNSDWSMPYNIYFEEIKVCHN